MYQKNMCLPDADYVDERRLTQKIMILRPSAYSESSASGITCIIKPRRKRRTYNSKK